ncbi:hypothetical protein [Muricoccus radiodurans]|uniref:hypothetical protein n=1 Tax=Muricoccus radiodurans TaxID=2231721 RepID=UPI003CEEEC44
MTTVTDVSPGATAWAGYQYGGTRAAPDSGPPLMGEEAAPMPSEMSFDEFLESINPLQHLPGVGTGYRAVTGQSAHPAARILVGALTGGPMGFMAGIGSVLFDVFDVAGTIRAIANGRDQPTAFLAWGETANPDTISRARLAYASWNNGQA